MRHHAPHLAIPSLAQPLGEPRATVLARTQVRFDRTEHATPSTVTSFASAASRRTGWARHARARDSVGASRVAGSSSLRASAPSLVRSSRPSLAKVEPPMLRRARHERAKNFQTPSGVPGGSTTRGPSGRPARQSATAACAPAHRPRRRAPPTRSPAVTKVAVWVPPAGSFDPHLCLGPPASRRHPAGLPCWRVLADLAMRSSFVAPSGSLTRLAGGDQGIEDALVAGIDGKLWMRLQRPRQ